MARLFWNVHRLASLLVVALLNLVTRSSSSRSSRPTTSVCFPPDLAALQDFAASFNSTRSPFFRQYWKPDLDCCSWKGVICGSPFVHHSNTVGLNHSRVTGLSLVNTSLSGQLPPALCRLSALSSLDLHSSLFTRWHLYGPIPSCLGHNLTSLQRLILAGHVLNSSIPQSFSRLLRLQVLDLSENGLSGSISPIANLSQLTHLDLGWNVWLNGSMPILNTPRIQYLDVHINRLSGPIPTFNTTPQLRYLDLSFNQWTGNIPSLPHLPHLRELNLAVTTLSSAQAGRSISQLFCDLISLRQLSIAGNYDENPEQMYSTVDGSTRGALSGTLDYQLSCEKPRSVDLTNLDLSNNHLLGPFPPWMGLLFNLQQLDLSDNFFSGAIPQEWQSLSHLTVLHLSSNSPPPDPTAHTQQLLEGWLFHLPLQKLTLRSIGLTTQEFHCESRLSLLNQTLLELDLSDNDLSDGLSLWNCFALKNFSSLSMLELSYNPLSFNLTRAALPLASPFLGYLALSHCQLFGTLTMELLSSNLTELYLGHNALSGSIPNLDPTTGKWLWLDLSFNQLMGPVRPWLWSCFGIVLNNNHLDGEISTQGLGLSILRGVGVLNLAHNQFSKAVFHNVSKGIFINIMDLSFNKLEGDLQALLGDYSVLHQLRVLILSHNHLTGSIPTSLGTSAPALAVLELSFNQLIGVIPESLALLPAMRTGKLLLRNLYDDFVLQSVKNVKYEASQLLMYLDLSSNLLIGSIPSALGELLMLNQLNLSRNQLSGHIPSSLGNLIQLEALDLAYNYLDGSIPTTLSQIHGLAVFNVSFNPKLSGQIPTGPQFEVEDSYMGDSKLCNVEVLHKACDAATIEIDVKPTTFLHETVTPLQWIEKWASIPGLCLGYALGFGLIVWLLKRLNFYK